MNSVSGNVRKVRTYLDCIEVKQNSTNGLNYIANFRYDNPNSETIYVLHGEDNRLTGEANYLGETPICSFREKIPLRLNSTEKTYLDPDYL